METFEVALCKEMHYRLFFSLTLQLLKLRDRVLISAKTEWNIDFRIHLVQFQSKTGVPH